MGRNTARARVIAEFARGRLGPQRHGEVGRSLGMRRRRISFSPQSAKPDEALQQRLAKLKGKPLTNQSFVDLLVNTASKLPAGALGIKFAARRPATQPDRPFSLRTSLIREW